MPNKKDIDKIITFKIIDENLGELVEKFDKLANKILKKRKEVPKKKI